MITLDAPDVVPPIGKDTPRTGGGAAGGADVRVAVRSGAGTEGVRAVLAAVVVVGVGGWTAVAEVLGALAEVVAAGLADPGTSAPGPGCSAAADGSDCGALPAVSVVPLMPITSTAHPATARVDEVVARIRPTDMWPVCQE